MSRNSSRWDTLRTRLSSVASCSLVEELASLDPAEKPLAVELVRRAAGNQVDDDRVEAVAALTGKVCIAGLEGLVGEMESDSAEGESFKRAPSSLYKASTTKVSDEDDDEALNVDVRLTETKAYLPPRIAARNRWRRLKNTVVFANHMAKVAANSDLLEEAKAENSRDETKAASGEAAQGLKAAPQVKSRGRKGMEGLLVEQDRGYVSYFQDFYVACLKMPAVHFFIGVFMAPLALAMIFTPFYLSDSDGLKLSDSRDDSGSLCDFSRWNCLNVFLYALSLSTTFGGSPITAVSPFCLLLANLHTLMAQFLFVFLSGAVFARMSQPAHPIRCSKKAIVKSNDFAPDQTDEDGKSKVFVVRLVLTGPPPCELVDAKIRLTFRIYMKLPSGSMFCSTQDLELVRSEVAYLRYGITVRHVVNSKSPIYGHTLDTLAQGDASFSLTVMGVERSSMQPIFHLEDYFVCDGDVIWDGDYLDFVRVNDKGQRVLDHSKIDMLKPLKVAAVVSQAITRMEGAARHKEQTGEKQDTLLVTSPSNNTISKLWKTMSNSFTRTLKA